MIVLDASAIIEILLQTEAGAPVAAHGILLPRVWALRQNLTAYDAVYVALAEILGATLLTRDSRILRAPGHFARVEVF